MNIKQILLGLLIITIVMTIYTCIQNNKVEDTTFNTKGGWVITVDLKNKLYLSANKGFYSGWYPLDTFYVKSDTLFICNRNKCAKYEIQD